jgi:hypothetical protein
MSRLVSDFAEYIGSHFQLMPAPWGQPHNPDLYGPLRTLKLVDISEIPLCTLPVNEPIPFVLVFQLADAGAELDERMYTMWHPKLSTFDVRISPFEDAEFAYQALVQ